MDPIDELIEKYTEAHENPDHDGMYPWEAWCLLCGTEADELGNDGWDWRSDHIEGHVEAGDLETPARGSDGPA